MDKVSVAVEDVLKEVVKQYKGAGSSVLPDGDQAGDGQVSPRINKLKESLLI